MVVGPWGDVLLDLSGEWSGEPELGICEVNNDEVENVRKHVPLRRRWDVYGQC
jgi:deaminated glutathione amidase